MTVTPAALERRLQQAEARASLAIGASEPVQRFLSLLNTLDAHKLAHKLRAALEEIAERIGMRDEQEESPNVTAARERVRRYEEGLNSGDVKEARLKLEIFAFTDLKALLEALDDRRGASRGRRSCRRAHDLALDAWCRSVGRVALRPVALVSPGEAVRLRTRLWQRSRENNVSAGMTGKESA